jgi:hypothetical protein
MSLPRSSIPPIPPEAVLVAKATFPSGNVYISGVCGAMEQKSGLGESGKRCK